MSGKNQSHTVAVHNNRPPSTPAPMKSWLAMPIEPSAQSAIDRVRLAEDVVHLAVMPDVHLARDVCVGTAMATRRLLYPAAVGGDIGCGLLAIAFDVSADLLQDAANAGRVLRAMTERIPPRRRHRNRVIEWPPELRPAELSHPALRAVAEGEGRLEMGTLGGGNHFVELQRDGQDRLWLMIHSGSRAMGQAVKDHHLSHATIRSASLSALDAGTAQGQAYLADQTWARRYAEANRRAMAMEVYAILRQLFRVEMVENLTIACDHNHVSPEEHFGQSVLVHRKGAMPAPAGAQGAIPGSMGTQSHHVIGLGNEQSLKSAAHGAGRQLSRQAARDRFGRTDLRRQMQGVWFDPRRADALRDESPRAYKDIRAVMRAQEDLVRVTRNLYPLLVFKT